MLSKTVRFHFKPKQFIYLLLLLVCISLFLITEFGLPTLILQFTDLILCLIFFYILIYNINRFCYFKFNLIVISIVVFFLYCVLSSFVTGVPFLQAFWSFRMTFRFYIFYYCCICLLSRDDGVVILRMFEALYFINIGLVLFEYYIQGKDGDYIGGIFGILQGANGYMNIYLVVMLIYEISKYFHYQQSLRMLTLYFIIALSIAVFAEMKFLYVEILAIIIFSIFFLSPTKRSLIFLIISTVLFLLGLQALKIFLPKSYQVLMGDGRDDYLAAAYTGGREMGRTNAISVIDNSFFSSQSIHNNYGVGYGNFILNKLFGFGFGSTEPSKLTESLFSNRYSYTSYSTFEFSDKYIELGFVGLFLYVLIFIIMFAYTFKYRPDKICDNLLEIQIVRTLIPLVFMNIWYGNLRTEASYILFFFLALPYFKSNDLKSISLRERI